MKFDSLIPSMTTDIPFTSIYMEAKVLEDFKLLNIITQNYNYNCLTESQALSLLDIVRKPEEQRLKMACESIDITDNNDIVIPPANITYITEATLPYNEIISSMDDTSVITPYSFERTWGNKTLVEEVANIIADEKENNLKTYKESEGKKGFTESERNAYRHYPSNRPSTSSVMLNALDSLAFNESSSLEDVCIMKGLLQDAFPVKETQCVSAMMPMDGSGFSEKYPASPESRIEDVIADTDVDIAKDELVRSKAIFGDVTEAADYIKYLTMDNGLFLSVENATAKNNLNFDTNAKVLYNKLKKYIKMTNPDADATFKAALNSRKDTYTFLFNDDANINDKTISNIIINCKYLPIKQNNSIVGYEKKLGNIIIEVDFDNKETGLRISYSENLEDVKESQSPDLEKELTNASRRKDTAVRDSAIKALNALKSDKVKVPEKEKKLNSFKHIMDNYNDVQKEKKKKLTKESVYLDMCKLADDRRIIENFFESGDNISDTHPLYNATNSKIESLVKGITETERSYLNSDYTIDDRKNLLCTILEEADEIYADYCLGDYLTNIMNSGPTKPVFESTHKLMESLFDTFITDEQFFEAVEDFAYKYEDQKNEEYIYDKVLDDSDKIHKIIYEERSLDHDKDGIADDIRDSVDRLNELGYTVKYSSSGFNRTRISEDTYKDGVYHGKLYTTARLTFDKKYNLPSIPNGWYENPNADVTSIYVRPYQYDKKDGTPDESFHKWKTRYMYALRKWVSELQPYKESYNEFSLENIEESFVEAMNEIIGIEEDPVDYEEEIFQSNLAYLEKELFS